MKKILSIIAFALGFAGSAEAVIVQKIYLKNGSVLSGYIQKQEGNGNLTFHTDIAEICLKSKDATISNEKNYNIKDLGKAWIDWAEKNDDLTPDAFRRHLLYIRLLPGGLRLRSCHHFFFFHQCASNQLSPLFMSISSRTRSFAAPSISSLRIFSTWLFSLSSVSTSSSSCT